MIKILAILLTLVLTGCSNQSLKGNVSGTIVTKNFIQALQNSYRSWLDLKEQYGANYSYERDGKISENYYSSTKIVVERDQVEFRSYFEWQKGNTPTETWIEPFAELNLHNQGTPAKTIDELYRQCKFQILNKPLSEYAITLKIDRFNLLQQCSYRQLNCAKNCTKGIRLQGLSIF